MKHSVNIETAKKRQFITAAMKIKSKRGVDEYSARNMDISKTVMG